MESIKLCKFAVSSSEDCILNYLGLFFICWELRLNLPRHWITQNQTQNQAEWYEMICNKSGAKMLLRQIKSESYGVLRYKLFRPSLSANIKKKRDTQWGSLFCVDAKPSLLLYQHDFFHEWYAIRKLFVTLYTKRSETTIITIWQLYQQEQYDDKDYSRCCPCQCFCHEPCHLRSPLEERHRCWLASAPVVFIDMFPFKSFYSLDVNAWGKVLA